MVGAYFAALCLLADGTEGDRIRRDRLMSFYELSSSGGIAVGAAAGPLLWAATGLWAFPVIAGAYLAAAALVALFVHGGATTGRGGQPVVPAARRWTVAFTDRRLARFLPAWVAATRSWVPGSPRRSASCSPAVGGWPGSASSARSTSTSHGCRRCWAGTWGFVVGRLPVRPVLAAAVGGAALASAALIGLNHGGPPLLLGRLVVVGMFLEAGFAPAALTYLADTSADFAADRGLIMGVYSVVLGVGYLAGNLLGGVVAQWAAFDGLAVLTIILAAVGLASVAALPRRPHSSAVT